MPVKYKLDIIIDETGEEISRSGELSDDEVKLLEDFVQYADEVWNTDFIQTGEKGKVDISFDQESGTQITTTLPDWNGIASQVSSVVAQ
jgi:hypothetical protein